MRNIFFRIIYANSQIKQSFCKQFNNSFKNTALAVMTSRNEIYSVKNNAGEKPSVTMKNRASHKMAPVRFTAWNLILPHRSRGSDSGLLSSVLLFLLSNLFFIRLFLMSSPPFSFYRWPNVLHCHTEVVLIVTANYKQVTSKKSHEKSPTIELGYFDNIIYRISLYCSL